MIYSDGYMVYQTLTERIEQDATSGWHTDFEITGPVDRSTHINLWIYLDDVSAEEGCTQLVEGSVDLWNHNLAEGRPVQEGIEARIHDTNQVRSSEAPAGGGLGFNGACFHRATPNRSGKRRRLISYEYDLASNDELHGKLYATATTEQIEKLRELLPDGLVREPAADT